MTDARAPRPYVDPTLVDYHAPAAPAAAPEPEPWQQASQRPRSTPARRARPPRVEKTGYFKAHWRGEHSLVRSYWVNSFFVATPLALALTGLMGWIGAKGDSLQLFSIVILIGFPLLMMLDVWCIVGAWRAAANYLREGGSGLWGWLARLTLALSTLQLAVSVLFGFLPDVGEFWQMARGIDPIGQATFTFSADGRSLRLDGVIGMGDGQRLKTLLASDAARQVKRVDLSSPGGRVREAERMVAAMKEHRHEARAVGTCASACTLVFLAGNPRQLAPEAQLGFHRASTGTYNPVFEELANQHLAKIYRELGLPQPLIDKTLRTPSRSIWFAPRDELQLYALIAAAPRTLAITLPAAGAPLADFDDALRMHPVWEALERRQEGTIAAVAQGMLDARTAGGSDDDVQASVLLPLAAQMPALINAAEPALRRRYVQLVGDQLRSLRAPPKPGTRPACRDLLDGRLAVRQQLPDELQVRETQWLFEAAGSPPARGAGKPPTALEMEVLERTVGTTAQGMLAQLWSDAAETTAVGAPCEPVIAMLDRLPGQPPVRRELVEKLMFATR